MKNEEREDAAAKGADVLSRKTRKREERALLRLRKREARKEEKKAKKDARKLTRIQKKSEKKLRRIEKKFEKVQIKSDVKAKKYVPTDTELPDKQKPKVGDPVLLAEAAELSREEKARKQSSRNAEHERIRSERRERKLQAEKEKLERKRIASGDLTMYERFDKVSFEDLERQFMNASSRDERAFYRALLNLKLQIEQEKVIGEVLL